MVPVPQSAPRPVIETWSAPAIKLFAALCYILLGALFAQAQTAPPNTVGRIEGPDVTVDGGASAGYGVLSGTPSIFVINGGVVTVHSGQAQMTLVGGGKVDICGPAKFAVLHSGAAITLALDFGKMRIQLPGAASLKIFTPTIIATPLDISGGARDTTVGLDTNDSLCVRATSGAIRLEHQFSGEKLVVPQEGEFFLAEGKLLPVAGAPGGCECAEMQARAVESSQAIPKIDVTAPPVVAVAPHTSNSTPAKTSTASEPPVELSALAHNEESKPDASKAKDALPPAPAVTMPEYTVIAPPLVFNADSPAPPPDGSPDTILLVRVAHIFPQWEFSGRVDAPWLAGSGAGSTLGSSSDPRAASAKRKGGFWSAVKRFFGGRSQT